MPPTAWLPQSSGTYYMAAGVSKRQCFEGQEVALKSVMESLLLCSDESSHGEDGGTAARCAESRTEKLMNRGDSQAMEPQKVG